MLSAGHQIKEAWVVLPILVLLLVGGVIAVQSGVERSASGLDLRQIVRNLSRMLLRVVAYVVLLVVLQYCIGLRPSLGW
jgi:hypothetical protein